MATRIKQSIPANKWSDLFLVTGCAGVLLLAVTLPAFDGFFFGEDFTHWGSYVAADRDFWKAVFSPHDHIFFRPAVKAFGIVSNLLLPADPLVYHIRNWLLTVLAAALLYSLLRRLTTSRAACLLGLSWFVLSKVHLTTIGYTLLADVLISLLASLAALYFAVVYFQTQRRTALFCSYGFYCVAAFSRDYGVLLVGVLFVAWVVELRPIRPFPWRRMLAQTAPYFGIAAIYFVIRGSILGEVQIPEGSAYKMSFDPSAILWRAWVFIGNIWNLSFETPGATGEGSYATWLASRLGFSKRWITGTELIFLASASALLAISVLRGARKNLWLLVPLLWIFLFIGPTFLIRNIQVYYILEPMAGAAMLLAIAVDSWKPPGPVLWRAWGIVLALAGLNTLVHSQHIHIYSWRFCADAAETVFKEIKADRGSRLQRVIVVARDAGQAAFWSYTITADGKGPLFPHVLDDADLRVRIAQASNLSGIRAGAKPEDLVLIQREGFDWDTPPSVVSTDPGDESRPAILRMVPSQTRAGAGFQVQPDGNSAIWIECIGATPDTVIVWDGANLQTTFGGTAVSGLVPRSLYAEAGRKAVSLLDTATGLRSEPAVFDVKPRARP